MKPKLLKEAANHLSQAAHRIRALRGANQSLDERMELVYGLMEMAKGPCRPPSRPMGMEEDTMPAMEKLSLELHLEAEKAELYQGKASPAPSKELHFPGPVHGSISDNFLDEMRSLSREVDIAADCAFTARTPESRASFVNALFKNLQAFQKRLETIDLRGPQ